MVFVGLARILKNEIGSSRRASRGLKRRGGRRMEFESLEGRALLSATGFATPNHQPIVSDSGVVPQSTTGATGYTPTQLRHAYGFDQIAFNNGTIPGDGSGTTIAIISAFDNPKIASDLHQFSLYFGPPGSPHVYQSQSVGRYHVYDNQYANQQALDERNRH